LLLDGLLGVLSLVFDVLSGRLALLLDALETFLSSRRLYRLGSLLGRWLQAFTRIPGYVGRLLLHRLEILLQLRRPARRRMRLLPHHPPRVRQTTLNDCSALRLNEDNLYTPARPLA
jgi:hypothetical protein